MDEDENKNKDEGSEDHPIEVATARFQCVGTGGGIATLIETESKATLYLPVSDADALRLFVPGKMYKAMFEPVED